MKDRIQTAVLILAAGSSSRMGSPKQLVDIQGLPLLQWVIKNIISDQYDIFVVTGCYRDEILRHIDLKGVYEIVNLFWKEGMGSSIREGVKVLLSKNTYNRIIVCVGDQVFVSKSILLDIIEQSDKYPDHIIMSSYGETSGPPVLFPAVYFEELTKLKGDQGAKSVIKHHVNQIITVPFERGITDIDTREDLKNLKS